MNDNRIRDEAPHEVEVREEAGRGEDETGVVGEERRNAMQRILVAVDASPHSLAVLHAAAELAALTGAELHGLFVEDVNLLNLGSFPFGREVGLYTATPRAISAAAMERQLRIMGAAIREVVARTAARSRVRWSFEVRRGSIATELLAAAQEALLLGIGRAGYMHQRTLGSTARAVVAHTSRPVLILDKANKLKYPLTVLYSGTPASERALHFAASLARRKDIELVVLVWPDPSVVGEASAQVAADRLQQQADQFLANTDVSFQTVTLHDGGELLATLRANTIGTLLLPNERASLLSEHDGPAILVP
jgi:nucleotide-binding universal stress UspA family protein